MFADAITFADICILNHNAYAILLNTDWNLRLVECWSTCAPWTVSCKTTFSSSFCTFCLGSWKPSVACTPITGLSSFFLVYRVNMFYKNKYVGALLQKKKRHQYMLVGSPSLWVSWVPHTLIIYSFDKRTRFVWNNVVDITIKQCVISIFQLCRITFPWMKHFLQVCVDFLEMYTQSSLLICTFSSFLILNIFCCTACPFLLL